MDSETVFDYIIVGGGVMGLGAGRGLHQLVPDAKVLLLDQFPLPHWRGSSHGHSRIYRVAYHHPVLSSMAADAVKEWREMEAGSGQTLLDNCGVLMTGLSRHIERAEAALRQAKAPFSACSFAQLCQENPARAQQLKNYPDHQTFLFDSSGGVMFADRCMTALLQFNREHGVTIRENERVIDINQQDPNAEVVVKTEVAVYSCRAVILTAGPWAPKFLATKLSLQLPIEPRLVAALYWSVKEHSDSNLFRSPKFVPLIDYYNEKSIDHMYSLPEREYPGCVKVGHQIGAAVDPDRREASEFPPKIRQFLSHYIGNHLPLVDGTKPAIQEACMYTQSADDLYVLDRHPRHPGVIIGAGFSGNGFKMGPTVGKILAALASNHDPGFDLRDFSVKRFGQHKAAL